MNYAEPVESSSSAPILLPSLKNSHLVDMTFMNTGLCTTTPSLHLSFFSGALKHREEAKAVCAECAVSDACAEFAFITEQEFGIWGGVDEETRKVLVRAKTA